MNFRDFVHAGQIVSDLRASDQWQAIDELIDNLLSQGRISPADRETIAASVKERERTMTTGIGFGIAIPHARTALVDDIILAIGRSNKGVNFSAIDNQPAHLVVLFLVPQWFDAKNPAHLQFTADLVRFVHNNESRVALENAPDAESMHQIIVGSQFEV